MLESIYRKKTIIIRRFIFLHILFIVQTAVGWAQSVDDHNHKDFRLGVEATEYPPYLYTRDGQLVGLEVDTIRAVLGGMGQQVEIVRKPWSELLMDLRLGRIDGLTNAFRTPEREAYAYYPEEPLSEQVQGLFVPNSSDFTWSGRLSQLSGQRIGAVLGESYGNAFDNEHGAKLIRLSASEILLTNVANGKLELAIADQTVICMRAKALGLSDKIRLLKPAINHEKTFLAFSKAKVDAAEVKRFSESLRTFHKTERWQEIIADHIDPSCWSPSW